LPADYDGSQNNVGGGYIFIRRMLLEDFAEMYPQELKRRISLA